MRHHNTSTASSNNETHAAFIPNVSSSTESHPAHAANTIIQVEHLNKSFGDLHAVQDLSFSVSKGELFAFLGTNGAGKTTTINIISGQLKKDSGRIFINGHELDHDLKSIKRDLGLVFQNSVLDGPLSVANNLESRAALYGITGTAFKNRLAELAELLDFKDLLKRTVTKLSGGQRRRIDVARALLHHPKILILDEPTTGLDPQTRKLLWQTIESCRQEEKMTVFLTTHYMEEAAEADKVLILDHGKIAAQGSPRELKQRYTSDFVTVYGLDEPDIKKLSARALHVEEVPGGIRLAVPSTELATELILSYPELFKDYEISKGQMDEVFLAVTNKSLVGGAL